MHAYYFYTMKIISYFTMSSSSTVLSDEVKFFPFRNILKLNYSKVQRFDSFTGLP